MDSEIRLTIAGDVATIRLSAAERRNAFTTVMMAKLVNAIVAADKAGVALIVLESDGADFSVGRVQEETGVSLKESLGQAIETNCAWTGTQAVTLCVVNGAALGFAFGLVVQSDLTIAEDRATFAFDEMTRGFVPKIVLSYLPELLPRTRALDLVLTGRTVTAAEAHALGLIGRVVATSEMPSAASAYVDTLVANGRASLLRDAKSYAARAIALPPDLRRRLALEESLRSMTPHT